MKTQARREIVLIDLVGELDSTMSKMLDRSIRTLDQSICATIIVRLERLESTQWAGLCDLGSMLATHRSNGLDVRADSRLRRVRAVLDDFAIPTDVPGEGAPFMRRRMIIARTPAHAVVA
ncbi:MAG: hypothetical protein ACREML_03400 [Vulcanimicrobiaceae bacterium]